MPRNNLNTYPVLVKKLEELRIKRGWSLRKLAKEAIVSTRTIERLYQSECSSLTTIGKIAKVLGKTATDLIKGRKPTKEESRVVLDHDFRGGFLPQITIPIPPRLFREVPDMPTLLRRLADDIEQQGNSYAVDIRSGSVNVYVFFEEEGDVRSLVHKFCRLDLLHLMISTIRVAFDGDLLANIPAQRNQGMYYYEMYKITINSEMQIHVVHEPAAKRWTFRWITRMHRQEENRFVLDTWRAFQRTVMPIFSPDRADQLATKLIGQPMTIRIILPIRISRAVPFTAQIEWKLEEMIKAEVPIVVKHTKSFTSNGKQAPLKRTQFVLAMYSEDVIRLVESLRARKIGKLRPLAVNLPPLASDFLHRVLGLPLDNDDGYSLPKVVIIGEFRAAVLKDHSVRISRVVDVGFMSTQQT